MSVEAEAILERARSLSAEERRTIAEALLQETAPLKRSIKDLPSFKPLDDVPPMKDYDDGFVEAIMYFKGMKAPREG